MIAAGLEVDRVVILWSAKGATKKVIPVECSVSDSWSFGRRDTARRMGQL